MPNKLIMIDHAAQDKRSIAAMLRGTGDGREQTYLNLQKRHPEMDIEAFISFYAREARYGRVGDEYSLIKIIPKKYYFALGIVLLVVF